MLTIVQNPQDIQNYYDLFKRVLINNAQEIVQTNIGYKGDSFKTEAFWSSALGIWMVFASEYNRSWNAFGLNRPSETDSNSITCEINFPYSGINRRIAGAFALDERGKTFVIHRGKIGGGRVGIGKNMMLQNYSGDIRKVKDGNKQSDVIIIGSLQSEDFSSQLAQFVSDVQCLKDKSQGKS
ncbi:MAG: ATPase associated with various cellular activity 5 [Firmicutes bacterium]|nr:ATPase associated with various cellular activity 5 [Bacillota bacterium]